MEFSYATVTKSLNEAVADSMYIVIVDNSNIIWLCADLITIFVLVDIPCYVVIYQVAFLNMPWPSIYENRNVL